jgi:hypothetical protein
VYCPTVEYIRPRGHPFRTIDPICLATHSNSLCSQFRELSCFATVIDVVLLLKNTLRGNPGCAVGPKTPTLGACFLRGEGSLSGYPPFPVPVVRERKRKRKRKRIRNRMTWRTFFLTRSLWRRRSVARFSCQNADYPAAELMRRDEWFAGRPLRVCEPFEERNTGAPSSRRGRGFPCCP